MTATAEYADAELVSQSLAGNRDAFEKIVARYQSLICSLAYSATGSISRSEDLAQDTFLAAWKQLRSLREPERLRSWLCGIARNLINNAFRKQMREPLHRAESLDNAHDAASSESLPSEQAINREEETIVWSALEQIPDLYREPLILFYRENQSVELVARQLELSQDAVKQRLSRGREMLRAQVATLVEGALKRSRPGRVFTLAVMAALPAVVAGSATAAGLGAAGKAAAPAAKALFAAGAMGGLLGGLGGLLGGSIGVWASWQTARYQRQRDLIRRSIIISLVGLAIFLTPIIGINYLRTLPRDHPLAYGIGLAAWILSFMVANMIWATRLALQFRRITAEEIAARTPRLPETPLLRGASRWSSKWEGRQWRSRWTLLGLPLIDINFSSPHVDSAISKVTLSAFAARKANTARGWIALGDRAYGILFACGNIAIGGIAIGGLSAGGLAIGGLAAGLVPVGGVALGAVALGGFAIGPVAWGGGAIGALAFGGLAIGWLAFGGGAFAWSAAKGGLACAHNYAVGGVAVGNHANDALAREFISGHWFFRAADWQITHVLPKMQRPWFVIGIIAFSLLLPALMLAVGYRRRRSVAIGLLAALLASLSSEAANAEKPRAETWTIANGIRVVSVYFPQSTNAAIFTFTPMGLVSDGPRQAQWSHLVEHLVIRSTIAGDLSTANAETLPDHMRLDFYGDSANWEEGLSHHQRWLRGVPFSDANLVAEKPKVKTEGEYTAKNFATHKFALAAWAQGFRHGKTNAAIQADIDRASLSEIQRYRDGHLAVLSNVLVCIVGGIEPAKVKAVASERFGAIKSAAKPAAAVKLHAGDREMAWDLNARHLLLIWPIPGLEDKEYPALMTAAQWLNMQFFSDAALQRAAGMTFAGADLRAPEGYFFYVSSSVRPDSSFKDIREKLERHVARLISGDRDLSSLPMIASQQADSMTTLPDPTAMKSQVPPNVTSAMLEMNLGLQWGMIEFRYGARKSELARGLSALKAEDVSQAGKKHLSPSRCSMITLQPSN